MLTHLSIENFKSLKNLSMDFGDINVLIGPNNSGKTSLLQTLALLKQSVNGFALNGKMAKLGTFKDAVYAHDLNKEMIVSFSFALRGQHILDLCDLSQDFSSFEMRAFSCRVVISSLPDGTAYVSESLILTSSGKLVAAFSPSDEVGRYPLPEGFSNVRFDLRGFIPFPSAGDAGRVRFLETIARSIVFEFGDYLQYVSSRRGCENRAEAVDSRYKGRPDSVGIYGENTIPVLAHIRDDENYSEAMGKIQFWLEQFGLAAFVPKFSEGPTYSLEARNKQTGIQSNILDVGFGLNQLIPIIVQSFYATKGSLIMMEQPEAHLHPQAQAKVADFLVDVVKYGNRVLVETHSEHLLLRLQRRIAEKEIDSKKVRVHYFESDAEGTKMTDMVLDEKGYFKEPLPRGFFEEGFSEALAHLKAAGASSDRIERGN